MKRTIHDPKQDELALSAIKAHALFPGRVTLYVGEVAKALSMTEQQVVDLIEEYKETGTNGIAAVNIASGLKTDNFAKGNKTPRAYWRIPVSAFDAFVAARKNHQPGQPAKATHL
jgi:hypothetical protein